MSANQYQLLKCEDCGKTLGYIYIKPKIGFLPPLYPLRYGPLRGQVTQEYEKTTFCETCFQKRLEEVTKSNQEPKIAKDETEKPRPKARDRSLIR